MKITPDDRYYKNRLKTLKPFSKKLAKIDARKKLTPAQKRQITIAFNEYDRLTYRPHKIFRPRSNKKLRTAQAFGGHESKILDVAFIPTANPKSRVTVKDDRIKISHNGITEIHLKFDRKKLAKNPVKEIERVINLENDANQYIISVGDKYLYNGGLTKRTVTQETLWLMERYNSQENIEKGNHWRNWLTGLMAIKFDDAEKNRKNRIDYSRQKTEIKAEKRKSKRRERIDAIKRKIKKKK